MPNPVAANDLQPISGSLQTSRISYGVETAGKNYGQDYNGTTWYSDIPNNGQFYTIISDNYTANYYVSRSNAGGGYVEGGLPAVDEYSAPVFWVTPGTSSLDVITIVNGLPDRVGQTPFNDGAEALNWIASSSNYFAVGPDYYPQVDADNLRLYLEGNQIISYPTTGSTWYDISGNTKNGTLENGLTFNSNGWFDFDGSDDDVNLGVTNTLYSGSNISWEVLFNADSTTGYRALFGNANTAPPYVALHLSTGTMGLRWEVSVTAGTYVDSVLATATINRWQHFVVTYDGSIFRTYLNGVATGTVSWTQGLGNNTQTFYIGRFWAGVFNGLMEKFRIYQKTLSAADASQNYYGGPIVTDGLFLAQDAGNLVSYPRTGTTLYDLTSNGFSGALTNGVGFSTEVGGALTFDGVDDYVRTDVGVPDFKEKTLEVWVRLNNVAQQGGGAINLQYDGGSTFDAIVYNETGQGWGFGSDGFSRTAWSGVLETSTAQWVHIVATYEDNNFRMYRNGILILTTTSFAALNYNTDSESLLGLRHNGATYLNASIAVGRIYSRALTQAEVLQNYNASF